MWGGNPIWAADPNGLRDVIVAVWTSRYSGYLKGMDNGSAGHVFVEELNGAPVLSQFPTPHGTSGINTTKSWLDTMKAEGRRPDAVYQVQIKNDQAFDATAAALRARPKWSIQPVGNADETNCTHSAYGALSAGGIKATRPWLLPLSPNDFQSGLQDLIGRGGGNIVTPLPSAPW
jgi:hypothetical protein